MSYIVGLTGGIGSGKSTIADQFAHRGAGLVDADACSHALTRAGEAGWAAIRKAFGAGFFLPDGELDRAHMRRAVFADPTLKARLESLLHPLIRDEIARQIAALEAPYILLMVPLLLEGGRYRERCQRVLVVDCSEAAQVQRVVARSAMSPEEVRAIMRTQIDRQRRLALADDIIDNDGKPGVVAGAIARLDHLYRRLAAMHERADGSALLPMSGPL